MLTICTVLCMLHRQMTMNRKMQSIMPAVSSQPSSHVPAPETIDMHTYVNKSWHISIAFVFFPDPSVIQV